MTKYPQNLQTFHHPLTPSVSDLKWFLSNLKKFLLLLFTNWLGARWMAVAGYHDSAQRLPIHHLWVWRALRSPSPAARTTSATEEASIITSSLPTGCAPRMFRWTRGRPLLFSIIVIIAKIIATAVVTITTSAIVVTTVTIVTPIGLLLQSVWLLLLRIVATIDTTLCVGNPLGHCRL